MGKSLFPILCLGMGVSAYAMTPIYEATPEELEAPARREAVITNFPAQWPQTPDRLWMELWCTDSGEDTVEIIVAGGKGADGKKRGRFSRLADLPEQGRCGLSTAFGGVKGAVDLAAVSNVTVRTVDGEPRRFGVARIVLLEADEKPPAVDEAPRLHVRDAAAHHECYLKFKEECRKGGFVVGHATSMENIRPRAAFTWRNAEEVCVRLARGEYESVQILVAPAKHDLKNVRVNVEMGAGFPATNITACIVGYSETIYPPPYVVRPPKGGKMSRPPRGWWPDPILDFQKSCDISGEDVQSFWVRVQCPREQKAGIYKGTLLVSAEDSESVRMPFSVRVYDFEVGRVAPLALAISVQPWGPGTNNWRNAWRAHPMETCDFFADYFITFNRIYNGPPAWDMLKRLKDQGRLGLFNLGYWYWTNGGEEGFRNTKWAFPAYRKLYEKAKELGLLDHAYFYGCDEEPASSFKNMATAAKVMKEEFPEVAIMTTAKDKRLGADGSPLGEIDIFCPPTCWWNPAQVERARREGRQVWWYFCNDPASPWANTTLEGPPCEIRSLMGAQTQKFKPDGFLYYATCNWNAKEPIKEGPFTKWEPRSYGPYHGDGQWTCCGGPDNMPIPTIRLENFRDGVEDLWYVRTLEKLYAARRDKEMVPEEKILKEGGVVAESDWCRRARELLAVPNDVVKSLREFSTDPDVIYRWRDAMADLIEEASRK